MSPSRPGEGRRQDASVEKLTALAKNVTGTYMKLRGILALVLLASLVLLGTLAYASPVDPGWVPGFYDDGDFDFVVDLITSESGVVQPFAADGLRPAAELVLTTVVRSDQDPALDPPSAGDVIRAPPAA